MQNLTWREVKERMDKKQVVLVPIGSTEQHGLHAPLGTDSIIADFLAHEVGNKKNIICTPTVSVGISDYHRQFWGTLWVSPQTLKAYVGEIVRSLHFHGINKFILVNGHGGNRNCLRELARELRRESIYTIPWTWFEVIEDEIVKLFGEPISPLHADCVETSVLWAINKKFVREELLKDSSRDASTGWGKYYNKVLVSEEVIDFSGSGAIGDPTKADIEKGKILLQKAKSNLMSIIDWLRDKRITDLESRSHKV